MSPEEKVDNFGPGISSEYTIISENDLPAFDDNKEDNTSINPP